MRLIFLFVAIALAAGAFVLTMNLTGKPEESPVPVSQVEKVVVKEVPTVNVFVARQEIPIGAIVNRPMLDIQPWPKHLLLPDFVLAGDDPSAPSAVEQMVARTPFQKGEVLMRSKLANPKDPSFLAASLPKGMRAVTIASDAINGVAGFIFPGDRVDVLITHHVQVLNGDDEHERGPNMSLGDPVTEVLLSDVRVMAVNQKGTAHGAEGPVVPTSITLEVSQPDAQKLRLASESAVGGMRRLSLALRSIKDKDDIELARPTGVGDLSRITPPAYFPVLYDNQSADYSPQVINLFEPQKPKGSDSASVDPVRVVGEQSALANLTKGGINQQGGKTVVAVIRGVEMKPVEVEGP